MVAEHIGELDELAIDHLEFACHELELLPQVIVIVDHESSELDGIERMNEDVLFVRHEDMLNDGRVLDHVGEVHPVDQFLQHEQFLLDEHAGVAEGLDEGVDGLVMLLDDVVLVSFEHESGEVESVNDESMSKAIGNDVSEFRGGKSEEKSLKDNELLVDNEDFHNL
jgi:hypothetical protein